MEFNVGDIVSLKSHPFFEAATNILISGDPSMLPPLMIISEVIEKKRSQAGLELSNCKCHWFSHKLGKFEYSWVANIFIKLISRPAEFLKQTDLSAGKVVALNSNGLELSKAKISQVSEDSLEDHQNTKHTINSLLSFVSPTLIVKSSNEHVAKSPLNDPQTKQLIRKVSSTDVHCVWFNAFSDRVSEIVLPIESLTFVDKVDIQSINRINEAIRNSFYIKIQKQRNSILFKPTTLICRHSHYFVRGYDFVQNRTREYDLINENTFQYISTPFVQTAPLIDILRNPKSISSSSILISKKALINNARKNKRYIRIKYVNRIGEVSTRTVIVEKTKKAEEGGSRADFLIAFCMLRKDKRTFNIERIIKLQELVIEHGEPLSKD